MLTKKECIQAINVWELKRTQYSQIESLINPSNVFSFDRESINWLNERSNYGQFHTYIGVHDEKLILILAPLDKNGEEVELNEYMTSNLGSLLEDLTLAEAKVATTLKKTTLSKELRVTNYVEEVMLSTYNEPTITERASVGDIENWKINSLDWFYFECNEFEGQRIFRTFMVPLSDLVKDDIQYTEVKVMFGLKYSSIYQRDIPILIFVAIDSSDKDFHKIIHSATLNSELTTNTADLSRPCPPMCIDKSRYRLLN